jgi:hypothetical protein
MIAEEGVSTPLPTAGLSKTHAVPTRPAMRGRYGAREDYAGVLRVRGAKLQPEEEQASAPRAGRIQEILPSLQAAHDAQRDQVADGYRIENRGDARLH